MVFLGNAQLNPQNPNNTLYNLKKYFFEITPGRSISKIGKNANEKVFLGNPQLKPENPSNLLYNLKNIYISYLKLNTKKSRIEFGKNIL